eukprot:gnl/MRDRNA2_/MRDRNA2_61275_c0_seq1.p1 gnl/MRDRNA2_/MRDRNA2_61275_c0~~gnl/MRDRNA2_/MRDRNA2_61275_c0_seq1.p1  ORF type:complete len:723 (-),score=220.34 gnl/MRDRNA2_/MRDRNA2_61275_c0_seq1:3-2171(-)
MDEIRKLQQQLMAAQATANVKKLHERNCVELVVKLISNGAVQLIMSTNGKEWLTPERLQKEIVEAINLSGGRLSMTELPNEIGVGIEHIEQQMEKILSNDTSLVKLQGEILSRQYLKGLAQELDESLELTGCLTLSELAMRFSLPADFVRNNVFSLLETAYVFKQNQIYTNSYEKRLEARIRGALRGATQPVSNTEIAAQHQVDSEVIGAIAQKLLKAGSLQGKYAGNSFTPQIFISAQGQQSDDFFKANMYLSATLAKSCGMTLKDFQSSKKLQGVLLPGVFLADDLIPPILANMTEALTSAGWVDLVPLLPTSLVPQDASDLVQHFVKKKQLPGKTVPIEHCIVSQKFLQDVASAFDNQVKEAAENSLKAPAAGKAATPKKAAKKQAAADDDDDDDWDDGPKNKKKGGKKAGGGAKGKKSKAVEEEDGEDAANAAAEQSSGVSEESIQNHLIEKYPDIPDLAHSDICSQLQPMLSAKFKAAQEAARSAVQSAQKMSFEKVEKFVQEKYDQLAFGIRSLEVMELLESPLVAHCIKDVMTEPLHRMLAVKFEELTGENKEITAANRKQILDKIMAQDKAKGASFKKVLDVIANKDHAAAVDALWACADDCNIFCRKVDKKREKQALQDGRAECREKLKDATDSLKVCELCLKLASIQDGAPGLVFPSDTWALKIVAENIGDEDSEVQKAALKLVELLETSQDDPAAVEEGANKLKAVVSERK